MSLDTALQVGGRSPECIYEDDTIRISGIRGGSKALFVAFTGIGHRLGALQREEFVKISQAEGANSVLFVQDKTRSWYNEPSFLEKLQPVVVDWSVNCEQVVTLGNSMGGFGAIVFAGALEADTAIAFSPQFSVSPTVVPNDRRWQKYRSQIVEFRYESAAGYIVDGCNYFLFQGDGKADWYQIGGFPIRSNLRQYVIPDGPHNLAALLRAHGSLASIVEASASGDIATLDEILVARSGASVRTQANDIYSGQRARRNDVTAGGLAKPADPLVSEVRPPPKLPQTREEWVRRDYHNRFLRRREARRSERADRLERDEKRSSAKPSSALPRSAKQSGAKLSSGSPPSARRSCGSSKRDA